jgi:uncharacterized protein (DUF302 family)
MEKKMKFGKFLIGVGLALGLSAQAMAAGGKIMETFTSKYDFDTVKQNVEDALTGRGLVVNNVAHIGEMLERTGKDLGAAKQVYVKAEGVEFCSATLSRKMMEADPHNIVFCPYVISVYVLPGAPDKTYVSFRKPDLVGSKASRAALQEVEKLLREIAKEATE